MSEPLTNFAKTSAAVVIGGGVAGLAAAYTLAQRGLEPLLVEERRQVGGLVVGAPVGGVPIDLGAESFAARSTEVAELCTKLGLEVITPQGNSWIWAPGVDEDDGTATPIPHGLYGIPARVDDPAVLASLSPAGAARLQQDLSLDPTVGAEAADLATLVSARMGPEVLDRIVRPVAGGIHACAPEQLAVDTVAPGLREKLRTAGSLSGAVTALRGKVPTPAIAAPQGGMFRLPQALAKQIKADGGQIATGVRVIAISPFVENADTNGWTVTLQRTRPAPNPANAPLPEGDPWQVQTPRLILALPAEAALNLLRGNSGDSANSGVKELSDLVNDWTITPGSPILHITLVVRAPELDSGPRGSGMLVAQNPPNAPADWITAKALTHYSYKWPWSAEAASENIGAGSHILRVSYRSFKGNTPAENVAQALSDASTLLGFPLTEEHLVASQIVDWGHSLAPFTPEHRQRVQALQAAVQELPGLAITGAWQAGTGLAAVIPHGLETGKL